MKFFKNILKKRGWVTALFSPKKLLVGIGKSRILDYAIEISKYPFKPAIVYPNKEVTCREIDEVHLDTYPPTLRIGKELIFISREQVDALREFAERNNIPIARRSINWEWITEPFLDTEFGEEHKMRVLQLLTECGFSRSEVEELREEISEPMYQYNFGTMLWEWVSLGLNDVLAAMRVNLNQEDFSYFYWKAMEIEQRDRKVNEV